MNPRLPVFVSILILCLLSCQKQKTPHEPIQEAPPNFFVNNDGDTLPTGVWLPISGTRIDLDTMGDFPQTVLLGEMESHSLTPEIHSVAEPEVQYITQFPRIITPGEDGIPLPKTVKAQGRTVTGSFPKPIAALPLQIRENDLLLNILPAEVARELKETGRTAPVFFEEVSILFADFKGFTNIVASIPGKKLVSELDDIFRHYDRIMEEVGLEKIQTVGDAYLAAAGLHKADPLHAQKCVEAGQRIIAYLKARNETYAIKWRVRLGIHSGPITAGVIGIKKFSYDIFGDTVNIAARIESSGEAGRINVSAYTYDLIKDDYACTYRGKIDAKGKGELDMYFVE